MKRSLGRCRTFGLTAWGFCCLTALISWAAPGDSLPGSRIILSSAADFSTLVSVNGKSPFNVRDAAQANLPSGLSLAVDSYQNGVLISNGFGDTVIEALGFDGWSAKLPANQVAAFSFATNGGIIDMMTPSNNNGAMEMVFMDGGKASMAGGSYARFDLMPDQSYYVAGRGRVRCEDADGQQRDLNQYLLPMAGGPLKRTRDAKGVPGWRRATPLLEVSISGPAGGDLDIVVGTNKYVLPSKKSLRIETPNGTVLDLVQSQSNSYLTYHLHKGLCRLWVGGVDCWSAAAFTGQSAAVSWDPGVAVDINSYTPKSVAFPAQDTLVTIARRISCSVPAGAGFSYVNLNNCTTFSASSSRGEVSMFNPDIGQPITISPNSVLYKNGYPVDPRNTSPPRNMLNVSWDNQGNMELTGIGGPVTMAPNSQRVVSDGDNAAFNVTHGGTGTAGFKAVGSDVGVRFDPVGPWTSDMQQGDTMTAVFDQRSGTIVVKANEGNTGPVRFYGPDGQTSMVGPGGTLTIMGQVGGSYLSQTEGATVFYEAAGGAQVQSLSTLRNISIFPDRTPTIQDPSIYTPRILQEPVTVSGK